MKNFTVIIIGEEQEIEFNHEAMNVVHALEIAKAKWEKETNFEDICEVKII